MSLKDKARELVNDLQGRLATSVYDTAWMARVSNGDSARWPDLIDWLLEHQWLDGSWGGTIRYYHDRILCTLAAIIALKQHGVGVMAGEAIKRGERYIWNNLQFLHHDPIELVGFELILPTLMGQARNLGLGVPGHSGGYERIRAEKLHLLPMDMLYQRSMPAVFSLEFLGDQGDPRRLHQLQGEHGAIANSPAATAHLLIMAGNNQEALDYLQRMKARPTGIPAFYPFRTFEVAWVLEHLAFGNLPLNELVEPSVWEEMRSALGPEGTGIDPSFGINDGDTTAVTLRVLALGGQTVDPMILHHFEEGNAHTFRTFAFERNASVATNAHALEALALMPDYPNREMIWDHVVATLLATQKYRTYWVDKWHASPYYATAHALIALMNVQEPLLTECRHSIDWLLNTQREDGAWGYFDRGTAEETAYALLALLHYHRGIKKVDVDVLKRGRALLSDVHQIDDVHPELWIAKTLYRPDSIVQASILAAMNLYQEVLGRDL